MYSTQRPHGRTGMDRYQREPNGRSLATRGVTGTSKRPFGRFQVPDTPGDQPHAAPSPARLFGLRFTRQSRPTPQSGDRSGASTPGRTAPIPLPRTRGDRPFASLTAAEPRTQPRARGDRPNTETSLDVPEASRARADQPHSARASRMPHTPKIRGSTRPRARLAKWAPSPPTGGDQPGGPELRDRMADPTPHARGSTGFRPLHPLSPARGDRPRELVTEIPVDPGIDRIAEDHRMYSTQRPHGRTGMDLLRRHGDLKAAFRPVSGPRHSWRSTTRSPFANAAVWSTIYLAIAPNPAERESIRCFNTW